MSVNAQESTSQLNTKPAEAKGRDMSPAAETSGGRGQSKRKPEVQGTAQETAGPEGASKPEPSGRAENGSDGSVAPEAKRVKVESADTTPAVGDVSVNGQQALAQDATAKAPEAERPEGKGTVLPAPTVEPKPAPEPKATAPKQPDTINFVDWHYLTEDVFKACMKLSPPVKIAGLSDMMKLEFDYHKYNETFAIPNKWPKVVPRYEKQLFTNTPWLENVFPFGVHVPDNPKHAKSIGLRGNLGNFPEYEEGVAYLAHLDVLDNCFIDLLFKHKESVKPGYKGTVTRDVIMNDYQPMRRDSRTEGFAQYQKFKIETARTPNPQDELTPVKFRVFDFEDKPAEPDIIVPKSAIRVGYTFGWVTLTAKATASQTARMVRVGDIEKIRKSASADEARSCL